MDIIEAEDICKTIIDTFQYDILTPYYDLLLKQERLIDKHIKPAIDYIGLIKNQYDALIKDVKENGRSIDGFSDKIKTALNDAVDHALLDVLQSGPQYAGKVDSIYKTLLPLIDSSDADQDKKSNLKWNIEKFNNLIHDTDFRKVSLNFSKVYNQKLKQAINDNFKDSDPKIERNEALLKKADGTNKDYNDAFNSLKKIKDALRSIQNDAGTYIFDDLSRVQGIEFNGFLWNDLKNFVKDMPTKFKFNEDREPGQTTEIMIRKSTEHNDLFNTIDNFGSAGGIEQANIKKAMTRIRQMIKNQIDDFVAIICNNRYNDAEYQKQYKNLIKDADILERTKKDFNPSAVEEIFNDFTSINKKYPLIALNPSTKNFLMDCIKDAIYRTEDGPSQERLRAILTYFR